MDVRPTKEVSLSKFGVEGCIVLEPLDFVRRKKLQNNIGKATRLASSNGDVELKSQDLGDISVYRVLAYITSAPFRYDTIESFYNYMARLDKMKLGYAEELFKDLENAIEELKEEATGPLDSSTGSGTPTSEQGS